MAQLFERTIGVTARVGLVGHEPNHAALLAGEIDLYADYLGTAVRRYLNLQPPKSAAATSRVVRDAARERWGIQWLRPFGFNNSYAVILRRALAEQLTAEQVADLVPHAEGLRLGATAEVLDPDTGVRFAPGGYAGLRGKYGLSFGCTLELPAEYGATFDALGAGQVDAIIDFPVNPRMVSLDLVELRDARHFFAPYFAAPVVSGRFLAAHPYARAALERLSGRVDNRRAALMNHALEMEGRQPEDVAAELVDEITADLTVVGRVRRGSHRRAG